MPKDALDELDISAMEADSCGGLGARKKRHVNVFQEAKMAHETE